MSIRKRFGWPLGPFPRYLLVLGLALLLALGSEWTDRVGLRQATTMLAISSLLLAALVAWRVVPRLMVLLPLKSPFRHRFFDSPGGGDSSCCWWEASRSPL